MADFNKTVLPELYGSKPDVVIFDFIDERYDLLRSGESYVTMTEPLEDSGFPGNLKQAFEHIPRRSQKATTLWREGAVCITSQIRRNLPSVCLVLHRAWWATEYVQGECVASFSANERRESERMNEQLQDYYDYFEQNVIDLRTVEVRDFRLASAQHRWGLAPYHYEQAYYTDVLAQILEVTSSPPTRNAPL
jgi:hypothetical protein